jgi:hypothetical protein
MTDNEYTARWRILAAQLREIERNAGIGDAVSNLRNTAALTPGPARQAMGDANDDEHAADAYAAALDEAERRELRALYFSVPQIVLRRSLIAKQRELDLFERTGTRIRLQDARRHLESIRRRPSEGWWIAAVVGATLVIVGYWLFALAGAIAAGVAALFVGNGIEQAARRRFEHAIAFAEEDVSAAEAAEGDAEGSRDLFSEREGATGQSDRVVEIADTSARGPSEIDPQRVPLS